MTFNGTGAEPKRALRDINLQIDRGQWCNVLGPNGSGKSTLLRALAGELRPTSGDVLIGGQPVLTMSPFARARKLFTIEQDARANLVTSMTIEENLLIATCNSRYPGLSPARRRSRRRKMAEALERMGMGLEPMLNVQVRSLSGGERQAIVLAKALLNHVPIMLLDEFLAAMDPKVGPRLLGVARELASAHEITVICVTHNLGHVLRYGHDDERIVLLREGKVVTDTTFAEVPSEDWLVSQYESFARSAPKLGVKPDDA